jgi:hypothetical protein
VVTADHNLLLALEATTALTFSHGSVKDELGHTNKDNSRALPAHAVLQFAPRQAQVMGIALRA